MKRLFLKLVGLSIIYCFSYSLLFAGSSSQPRVLTLADAIRIALENNADLSVSRLDVDQADARVSEAVGYALPAVDLSGRYSRALKKQVFFLPDFQNPSSGRTAPIEIGSTNAIDMSLSARQVLFSSVVFTGVGASKVYLETARDMHRAKEVETVANVRKAFYRVLLAAEAQELMHANLSNAEENLGNVRLMSGQGLVSEYDELRASVAVENLRPLVIQTDNNYVLAVDALRDVMGLPPTEEFQVADTLSHSPVDEAILESAVGEVTERNPSLQGLRHQIGVNEALVSIQRAEYLPTLAAFGNYQYQLAKNDLRISTSDFIGSSLVGLNLSMNIFQGWQTNARIEQAKLEVRKTEERLRGVEKGLRTQTHSIVLRLREAQKRIEAQAQTVAQAEKGYRIATTRFLNGAGTQLEVNDAQLALTQAKVNRIQAVYDYMVASADFDEVLGRVPNYVIESLR
jgi:outer membrane protein TolC